MKKIVIICSCLFALVQTGGAAFACDLCAIYRSMEAKSSGPGLNIGLYEQFTYFNTVQQDGHKLDNPAGQYLGSSITQVVLGYQVNDRFGVQVNVPYIYRKFKRPDGMGGIDSGTESGIGDMSLIGHYRVWQHLSTDTIFSWDVIGGVKFPTGDTSRIKEELAEMDTMAGPPSGIHGHDLALGSGSFDGIVGTGIFARWQRLFLTGGVQYALRTRGDFDYRYANDLNWFVKPGAYLWLADEGTLGLQLAVTGEDKGKDDLAGATAEDTGITSVFIGPEFSFTWKENLSAELGAEFPVVSNNTALQVVPDYRVKAAVTWRF